MRISDWSSDVCSSDLRLTVDRRQLDPRGSFALSARITDASGRLMFITDTPNSISFDDRPAIDMGTITLVKTQDRKSVVKGKSGSVRVNLGCRRISNKKHNANVMNISKRKTI